MAGFNLIIAGRFWVIPDTTLSDSLRLRAAAYWMRTSTPNLLSPTATGNIAGRGTWFERIDFFLTKEVLKDHFPIGAPLGSMHRYRH